MLERPDAITHHLFRHRFRRRSQEPGCRPAFFLRSCCIGPTLSQRAGFADQPDVCNDATQLAPILSVDAPKMLAVATEVAFRCVLNRTTTAVCVIDVSRSIRPEQVLAATRPHCVVLQHAPIRDEYDGFRGYELATLNVQIQPTKQLYKRKVVAITIKHEGLAPDEIPTVCERIERETDLSTIDILRDGAIRLANILLKRCGQQSSVATLSQ